MSRAPMIQGPMLDADEAKLQRLEQLIREAKEAERQEALRKAEEERLRRERESARGSLDLAGLEAAAAKLREQIALRQHHLRAESEREILERRAQSLRAEIEGVRGTLVRLNRELSDAESKLKCHRPDPEPSALGNSSTRAH